MLRRKKTLANYLLKFEGENSKTSDRSKKSPTRFFKPPWSRNGEHQLLKNCWSSSSLKKNCYSYLRNVDIQFIICSQTRGSLRGPKIIQLYDLPQLIQLRQYWLFTKLREKLIVDIQQRFSDENQIQRLFCGDAAN